VEKIEELVHLVRAHSDVPICLDTQGAQVRTGSFQDGPVTLESGAIVALVTATELGDSTKVPLYPSTTLPQLAVGDLLTLDTLAVPLLVVQIEGQWKARVLNGGPVGSNKAVVVDRPIKLDHLTESDRAAVELGKRLGIKHFALSFANRRDDVLSLREMVGADAQIISKIESRLGLQNLDGIMEASDSILIDRGDLSREVPMENLPLVQKEIIRRANKANVPVYVATNLLESMVASPKPTRAEVNDVVNTLIDGADGLVLAAETAIGKYPVQCISMIRTLISHYESRTNGSSLKLTDSVASSLTPAHGNQLVQRIVTGHDWQSIDALPKIAMDQYTLMDATQIAVGAFSPLQGFMGKEELECVLEHNRLPNGIVWPMPILFQLPNGCEYPYGPGDSLALTAKGTIRGLLHTEEQFTYDLESLAQKWFGTSDREHAGVGRLFLGSNRFISGKVELLSDSLPIKQPYDLTPTQARYIFEHRHWQKVVGFHTRNVPHRAHEYLHMTALTANDGDGIFIHPVIGPKRAGDFSGDIILESYQLLIDQVYTPSRALLGGFSTYARYAGPREAVFTAICRQNFGCTHFIVGRDHTGVGNFYHPDASKRLFDEIGDISIQPIFFDEVYYCQACETHVEGCQHGRENSQSISGTWARTLLSEGKTPPEWYMRGEVSALIQEALRNGNEVFSN
jgi:ATP sulfurylase